jgi:hypothetical protein
MDKSSPFNIATYEIVSSDDGKIIVKDTDDPSKTIDIEYELKGDDDSELIITIPPYIPATFYKNKFALLIKSSYLGLVYLLDLDNELINAHNLNNADKILRVHDITNDNNSYYFDIKINNYASNWYIEFPKSNSVYVVEFGYIKDDQFIKLLRSNVARTPRSEMSDQFDEEWMSNEGNYLKILEASGINRLFEQIGSQELIKFLASNNLDNPIISSFFGSSSFINANSSRNFKK